MKPSYIYTYACHEDEIALCELELRTLFGTQPSNGYVETALNMDPSRSPFIKQRVSLLFTGQSLAEIARQVTQLELNASTFKVVYIEIKSDDSYTLSFEQKREIEREVGWYIRGKADMRKPKRVFAIMRLGHRWLFGGK
jgi:hypothetical protein